MVLREFQNTALLSISTAISFALLRARAREKTRPVDEYSTHENGPRKGSAFTVTRYDPFEIRGFEPIFPCTFVQQAEPSSLWITYRALPRYARIYTPSPSYAILHIFAYIFCRSVISCFGKKMNQPLSEMSYLCEMYVYSRYLSTKNLMPMKIVGEMDSIQFVSRFYLTRCVIDFTWLSKVNLIPTACLQCSEKFSYTSY